MVNNSTAPRTFILVLDSLGIGETRDAADFNDVGANTLGNLADAFAAEKKRPMSIPNLCRLGLAHAYKGSTGKDLHCKEVIDASSTEALPAPISSYGAANEISTGKDTPSGHWEMMGVPVLFDWGYFKKDGNNDNCFPPELLEKIYQQGGIEGSLCNGHASGTEVIRAFGDEHIKTGLPIIYTSADSVFQIAAHEEHFGLERLLALCELTRELLEDYNIGRVIARPFDGDNKDNYTRTGNRRDYSILPPSKTMLEKHTDASGKVVSIGKIADIFAHQGISEKFKANGLEELMDTTEHQLATAPAGTLVFTNLVDFDMHYGHRRDPIGYALALEYLDSRLDGFINKMNKDDILVLTADHGCDPTWPGSDHTRERIPVIFYGATLNAVDLGERDTFADIGQTLTSIYGLPAMEHGNSFYSSIF
ncbi:MAG: phosphopentomutase [Phenylobacterium sp.]|jgi:phosphopentomutase